MPTRSDDAARAPAVPNALGGGGVPIRRAARRLRWFKRTFIEQVEGISAASKVRFHVDEPRLGQVFVAWLRAFEAQKPADDGARRAYTHFASGLMLRQLVTMKPLAVTALPPDPDMTNPAYYWPEGYVYVAYCLNVRGAVLAQDFHEELSLAPDLSDISTWWTFRENVSQDSALAIAFLDLFSGAEPNWSTPGLFYREAPRLTAGGTPIRLA